MDLFAQVLAPVVGGLGLFLLGLEFMADGIQAMAVNRMRAMLARLAGTPIKGLLAGTLITAVIQSSTAMTVMVVGLVNAGVLGLRPAISVIMGANIGTTLTNALVALPLGLWGLFLAGIFAIAMVFSRREATRNLCLALLGFCLIFYGLGLMTGGLRPLRDMPDVMAVITGLRADGFAGLLYSVIVAAVITALIHSSSATIGIVMGLAGSGILDWQTALAFSLGADLGTTITSFIASLNLSRNAKRTAYAHIAFNLIGVAVMLPLFPLACQVVILLVGDPGIPTMTNGGAAYPLAPVAVGVYSIAFNIFNTALLFPFVGTFERVLARVGHTQADDIEDYSRPRFITAAMTGDLALGVPAVRREIARLLWGAGLFLHAAQGRAGAPDDAGEHRFAVDVLGRDIRRFTADLFRPGMSEPAAELVGSLITEADLAASVGDALYQTAHRVTGETFSDGGRELVDSILHEMAIALDTLDPDPDLATALAVPTLLADLSLLRRRTLHLAPSLTAGERGALLALLGSAERMLHLVARIDVERRSVPRMAAGATLA
ncbi:phosphate:Na+ symporter [Stella humosa]|uniref:Phosphate:Na+ symporter n=1 Tax=Stella humosa TaxID=94 RepID=A0A3N1LCX3_9PROT|nr:Na/Pi symporter [Stella humosa]ROP90901.1 phosphate:Na+ symporter [Stella humosa]